MFYALAKNQDLIMSKVDLFVALAPVVYMKHVSLALEHGVKLLPSVMNTADKVKLYSLFNPSEVSSDFSGPAEILVNGFVKLFTATFGPNLDLKESSTK